MYPTEKLNNSIKISGRHTSAIIITCLLSERIAKARASVSLSRPGSSYLLFVFWPVPLPPLGLWGPMAAPLWAPW